jgi:deoxyhypusine synthase
MKKSDLLNAEIQHLDFKKFDATPIIKQYKNMAFQARNLARAAEIYTKMLQDKECSIILCLAGSLFSAGLKKVVYDLIDNNMVDAIVSTGAIMVDQDFFEGLGYKHYIGSPFTSDDMLFKNHIDRIYDTYIDEDELRECDMTVAKIAEGLEARPYSSQEFVVEMGKYLQKKKKGNDSVVKLAYQKGVPIFIPAFSDCSAGLGLAYYQWKNKNKKLVTIDSAKDFLDLTKVKVKAKTTGLFMIGGGVPKNFAQDTTVAAEILGAEAEMHKYAIQVTVADERDGALSGSTLKEAHSWGKVGENFEQMVFAEATIAMPLIASYAYHQLKGKKARQAKNFNSLLNK